MTEGQSNGRYQGITNLSSLRKALVYNLDGEIRADNRTKWQGLQPTNNDSR